jgi:hypothetical protein
MRQNCTILAPFLNQDLPPHATSHARRPGTSSQSSPIKLNQAQNIFSIGAPAPICSEVTLRMAEYFRSALPFAFRFPRHSTPDTCRCCDLSPKMLRPLLRPQSQNHSVLPTLLRRCDLPGDRYTKVGTARAATGHDNKPLSRGYPR